MRFELLFLFWEDVHDSSALASKWAFSSRSRWQPLMLHLCSGVSCAAGCWQGCGLPLTASVPAVPLLQLCSSSLLYPEHLRSLGVPALQFHVEGVAEVSHSGIENEQEGNAM